MVTLENIYHNFPLLAHQSGFNFQLHRGRVNWSEIENLDINEITERRNFELLEQNLVNVTNCNLERECDFKMLDQNFAKLFKLAQLGIDYLSYCEMYLDKCVVLLQEQLNASQDECELLKKKIQGRKEIDKNQNKNKTLNYQCEKCAKVFISDVYLKFHEKRRHGNTNTPDNFDESPPKCSCDCQKREENRKLSTSTQTIFSDEVMTFNKEKEDENNTKMQYVLKMEKLERELENLKERFKKAENIIAAKTEASKPEELHSINVPNSMHYNSMLMLLPSYLTHLGNGYCDIISGCQLTTPEVSQSNINLPSAVNSDPINIIRESMSGIISEPKMSVETKCEMVTEEKINSSISDIAKKFQECQSEGLECEKENLDPRIKAHDTNVTKPLPPPRKGKKRTRRQSDLELRGIAKRDANEEGKTPGLNNDLIVRSTPVKEKPEETELESFEKSIESINQITNLKANSFENLQVKKSVLIAPECKSFTKKIVTRDSSSIQKLNKNFNTSLNTICDSASFTETKGTKKETNFQNLRTAMMNGLNNHLQRLGISSEWNGIPRKTMRQKLSAWKHQRRLLFKENSLYPLIRQNIEEKIFQKLKKLQKRKEETSTNKLTEQESMNFTTPEIPKSLFEKKSELIKSKNCMYDTDTDSESRDSVSCNQEEQNYSLNTDVVKELLSSMESINLKSDKKSHLLLAQAERNSLNNEIKESNKKPITNTKLFIDSDTESSFLENFHKKSFKTDDVSINYDEVENYEKPQFEVSGQEETAKINRSESILKDAERFQTKPLTINQKKVLFTMYSEGMEEELSEDPTDDDLWSLNSDKGKCDGTSNLNFKCGEP